MNKNCFLQNKTEEGEEEGDNIESILAPSDKKPICRLKDELSGADALAEAVGETCDMDGMDEKVSYYNTSYYTRSYLFSVPIRFILRYIVFHYIAS